MGRGALALLGNREGQAIYWSGWLLRGHRSCMRTAYATRCMHFVWVRCLPAACMHCMRRCMHYSAYALRCLLGHRTVALVAAADDAAVAERPVAREEEEAGGGRRVVPGRSTAVE